jgi:hypothetical protein
MDYIYTQDIQKYSIKEKDGQIGHVTDFYFDEVLFDLRYLVVDTKPFLLRNFVLITPKKIKEIDPRKKTMEILATKHELEALPSLDSVEIISQLSKDSSTEGALTTIRSSNEVCTYTAKGIDGELGHIKGFLLNSDDLSIDFFIVDTINYFSSKNVLLRPEWIENISSESKKVEFPFLKELIRSAPEYDSGEVDTKAIEKSDKHFIIVFNEYKKMNQSFYNIRNEFK